MVIFRSCVGTAAAGRRTCARFFAGRRGRRQVRAAWRGRGGRGEAWREHAGAAWGVIVQHTPALTWVSSVVGAAKLGNHGGGGGGGGAEAVQLQGDHGGADGQGMACVRAAARCSRGCWRAARLATAATCSP